MRQVATIAEERAARRLADHLLAQGITNRLIPGKDGFALWVHREDQVDSARSEVEQFLADPDSPRYDGASKAAALARREAERRERQHARNTVNLSGRLNVPSFGRCPVTYTLIGICVVVAVLTGLGHGLTESQPFLFSPVKQTMETREFSVPVEDEDEPGETKVIRVPVPAYHSTGLAAIRSGQFWRLISPIFLHFGLLHIAFNMTMLYRLGGLIELRKGSLKLLGLVLATALISNVAQYLWHVQVHGADSPQRFGGMSGVIYGLFGYCWMVSDYEPEADMRVPNDLIVWMVLWLLLCMTDALNTTFGRVANAAHVAGLFAGLVLGVVPHLWPWRRER